jgi:hypothetical protein
MRLRISFLNPLLSPHGSVLYLIGPGRNILIVLNVITIEKAALRRFYYKIKNLLGTW